jgi:hypothetical protein
VVEGHVEMLTAEMRWMTEAKIQHSTVVVVDRVDAVARRTLTSFGPHGPVA